MYFFFFFLVWHGQLTNRSSPPSPSFKVVSHSPCITHYTIFMLTLLLILVLCPCLFVIVYMVIYSDTLDGVLTGGVGLMCNCKYTLLCILFSVYAHMLHYCDNRKGITNIHSTLYVRIFFLWLQYIYTFLCIL